MKCRYCNADLEASAKFCRYCGRRLDAEFVNPQYAQVNNAVQTENGGSKKKFVIIPIIIAASVTSLIIAIVLGIGIYKWINNGGVNLSNLGGEDIEFDCEDEKDDEYENGKIEENVGVKEETDPFEDNDEKEPAYESLPKEESPAVTYPSKEEYVPEEKEESQYDDNDRVVIAHGGLRMRNKPDIATGAPVSLIPNGTLISVEKIENNWAYTYYDGTYGWCSCDFLFAPYDYDEKPIYTATVNNYNGVDLSTEKHGTAADFYTIIPNAQTVYVYKIDGNRAFVKFNNIYGWCSTESLVMHDMP